MCTYISIIHTCRLKQPMALYYQTPHCIFIFVCVRFDTMAATQMKNKIDDVQDEVSTYYPLTVAILTCGTSCGSYKTLLNRIEPLDNWNWLDVAKALQKRSAEDGGVLQNQNGLHDNTILQVYSQAEFAKTVTDILGDVAFGVGGEDDAVGRGMVITAHKAFHRVDVVARTVFELLNEVTRMTCS